MMRRFLVCTTAALAALTAASLGAQGATGSLSGSVTMDDSSALPGVMVTLSPRVGSKSWIQVTNAEGAFSFLTLAPGRYDVTFALEGFQTVRGTVTVDADKNVSLDSRLTLAETREGIVVPAASPSVSTSASSTGSIGGVIYDAENADGTRSLQFGIAGVGIFDRIEIDLPEKLLLAEFGYTSEPWTWDGEGTFTGSPTGQIFLRLDLDDVKVPKKLQVEVFDGDQSIFEDRLPVEPRTNPQAAAAENAFHLPPCIDLEQDFVLSPKDEASLRDAVVLNLVTSRGDNPWRSSLALDETSSEGSHWSATRWRFSGRYYSADQHWNTADSTRGLTAGDLERIKDIPLDDKGRIPVHVRATDPWGNVVVQGDWTPWPPPPGVDADQDPILLDASSMVSPGGSLCVCGVFPDLAGLDGCTLGGTPLGPPIAASGSSAIYEVPLDMPHGAHDIQLPGLSPPPGRDRLTTNVIGVDGSIDQDRLWTGQSTPVQFFVTGTERPFPMLIENRTPGGISLSGGDRQLGWTSGGSPNEISQQVTGLKRGEFIIDYSINTGDCPCVPPDNEVSAADRAALDLLTDLDRLGATTSDIERWQPGIGYHWQPEDGQNFLGNRFRVQVDWGESGASVQSGVHQVPGGAQFWFFEPDNWEVLVKVLDGCDFNDFFWVFSASTSNVDYTLTVTDTESKVSKEYSNALGQAADAITDTQAFATCP